jgi:peptidoglycan/LPS O-acetylase OafA/YrhL
MGALNEMDRTMGNSEAASPRPRTDFIDRLRVVLTVLVIVHHAAITYGGSGGWFYREVTDGGLPSSMTLTLLTAVNQAFFMGMFFLLAGYFTPASLAKKGAARYLGDRLIRLGVPLVIFGFVLARSVPRWRVPRLASQSSGAGWT